MPHKVIALSLLLLPALAPAQERILADGGKLLLTAGFNDVDGAGGGGLVPWALITGYGTDRSWGLNGHYTCVRLRDLRLRTFGAAVGVMDRLELSAARQELDFTDTAIDGLAASQDVVGVKLRIAGDAVYAQRSWLPQLALGAQFKRHRGIENAGALTSPVQLGARDDEGVDVYAAASKLFLAQSLFVNVTARYSSANQLGLLGFGGGGDDGGAAVKLETTVAWLLTRRLALGGEYRDKRGHLAVDEERGAWTAFVAYAPNRHVSVVAAYANLGAVLAPVTAARHAQAGSYLSLQLGF